MILVTRHDCNAPDFVYCIFPVLQNHVLRFRSEANDFFRGRYRYFSISNQRTCELTGLPSAGAYLQYAHVRLCSVARKVAPDIILRSDPSTIDTSLLVEPKLWEIVLLLASYPDVLRTSLKLYEASSVVTFCFKLCHLISSVWETVIVKGQEEELAQARLLLYTAARIVLGNALTLLSTKPLERM